MKIFPAISLAIAGLVLIFFLLILAITKQKLLVMNPGNVEYDWSEVNQYCHQQAGGWRLPSIIELIRLYHFSDEMSFIHATDYWSQTDIGDYVFGLNTGTGLLSFDRKQDQDHFVCVK